jgi:hypothetical protein
MDNNDYKQGQVHALKEAMEVLDALIKDELTATHNGQQTLKAFSISLRYMQSHLPVNQTDSDVLVRPSEFSEEHQRGQSNQLDWAIKFLDTVTAVDELQEFEGRLALTVFSYSIKHQLNEWLEEPDADIHNDN